jgi:hypothetical protein
LIFILAILVFEYLRSSRKEAAKEEERVQELLRIQAELKELYFAKARQETQIRELIRILHVNIPSASFSASHYDVEDIPIHHRTDAKEEEGSSIFQSMNRLIWSAVDMILPPVEDASPADEKRPVVIKVVASSSDPSSSSSSQTQGQCPAVPPATIPGTTYTPSQNSNSTNLNTPSKESEKKV